MRRHRAAIASNAALAVAAGAVLVYAAAADGYRSHEAELNDGGIWVVNGDEGIHGRINKPINQLDAIVFDEQDTPLDVVQDGAAVVSVNKRSGVAQVIDPATSAFADGAGVSLPVGGDLQMAGGTLASLDPASGQVWAVGVDTVRGKPLVSAVDRQSEPLAKAGRAAALAVTSAGTVVVTSAEEGTVTYLEAQGQGFGEPRSDDLGPESGSPTAVTTVGERVVTFDAATGGLAVIGGGSATLPEDSVLQQPGPDADAVLVATRGSLLSVDLASGASSVVTDGLNGRPAEPVRLGACVYGAWSGGLGAVAVQCGDGAADVGRLGGRASNLSFRQNRGEIVLNDSTSGSVWDVQLEKPQKIDDWDAFTATKKVEDEDQQDEQQSTGDRRPPKAKADSYGARPGRTTVLHPLDNDSAPEGRLLSIRSVDQPAGGARATISPDGQTVQLTMPERARATSFEYFIDDGRNLSAHATVTVGPRSSSQNTAPKLREGYEPHTWRVPAGGALSVPVLADWRDDSDGDPLVLDSAEAIGGESTGAQARTTAEGRLRFTAPADGGGVVKVQYAVADGLSEPVTRTMSFAVQERLDQQAFAATAEPDVVRGEVGSPIVIRPLANDLPGSDPSTPNAELALGGRVANQPGTAIKTDLENGLVTLRSDKPGTYFLDYDAAYGNAPVSHNKIRVDVQPKAKSGQDPVATPDTLTLYDQAPAIVDVLANDLDPAGGLLVVQAATADRQDQLDVAIIDGRWLRISVRQGQITPNPQLVRYTISNGTRTAEGEVAVSQRPTPKDNAPITATDRVVVRAGSSVAAPVLDNDLSPSGDKLSLVGDVAEGTAGELPVKAPLDVTGDVGRAFVSGRVVRYVAPADLEERDTFEVPYVAVNTSGDTAPGRLLVTITPADAPNTAPEPPTLEGRGVSGDALTLRLPGSGVDPDGDPVAITGITSAPRLGRLLSFGANSLEYQAYPGMTGTDEFSYSVVDTQGAVATGTVRVAVVAPGAPQPPLAVADVMTVEPGRTAIFDPLANDHLAPGDEVEVELVSPPAGVTLDSGTSLVSVAAPPTLDAPAVQVVYTISNGIDESRATLTLRTAADFDNPPVVYDAYGNADDSDSVAVDVLEGAYDPDGSPEDLRVTKVYGDPAATSLNGSRVKVLRGPSPKVVPFRVEDADGAAATASLYVPPTGTGVPYVKPGAIIELEQGGSARGRLSDYVVNPSGGDLRLTGRDRVLASPAALSPRATDATAFEIGSAPDYRGPGALLLEVTTATDRSGNEDPEDPTDGYTALLSIPVQVGDDTPVLECPETTIPISQDEQYDLDIASLCHVWTLDPRDAPNLDYQGTFTTEVDGLSVSGTGTPVLRVAADSSATSGGEAVLSVRAGDSNAEEIRFRLAKAPPPTLLPIRIEDMVAGEGRTVDLAPYLEPGVADPSPTLVSVSQLSNAPVATDRSGQSALTIKPGAAAQGRVVLQVVMSDVDDPDAGPDRRVEGRIEFEVRGVPGAPSEPHPFVGTQANKVSMGWFPPKDDGGSPITHYVVEEVHTGKTQTCRTNQCDFTGLKNGQQYNFRVRAVNKVGDGEWSGLSKTAYADTAPGRVQNIRMVSRGDHSITVAWDKPTTNTSKVLDYTITWQGGTATVPGNQTAYPVAGLDNNTQYVFSIKARNAVNYSLARASAPMQPVGTPAAPTGVGVTDTQSGSAQTALRVTWAPTLPEGPAPTTYTLFVSKAGGSPTQVPGCVRIQATQCLHSGIDYDGTTYSYLVRAANFRNQSAVSEPASFEAVGKPAGWGTWGWTGTGNDQEVQATFSVPDSRGSVSRVDIIVNGAVVKTFGQLTGNVTTRFSTPGNDNGWPAQLRVCNENADRGGCTVSSTQTVQSFGPLTNRLSSITSTVSGKTVTWTITGTSNGNAAMLAINTDGVGSTVNLAGQGVGPFTVTKEVTTADFRDRTTIDVSLYDDNPGGRGESRASQSATSGEPPPPSINGFKRASCTDGDADPANNCSDSILEPICDVPSCGFVGYTVSGFLENFSCSVTNSAYPGRWFGQQYDHPGGQTVTFPTDWYYDAGVVTLTCQSKGKYAQTATTSFGWPG